DPTTGKMDYFHRVKDGLRSIQSAYLLDETDSEIDEDAAKANTATAEAHILSTNSTGKANSLNTEEDSMAFPLSFSQESSLIGSSLPVSAHPSSSLSHSLPIKTTLPLTDISDMETTLSEFSNLSEALIYRWMYLQESEIFKRFCQRIQKRFVEDPPSFWISLQSSVVPLPTRLAKLHQWLHISVSLLEFLQLLSQERMQTLFFSEELLSPPTFTKVVSSSSAGSLMAVDPSPEIEAEMMWKPSKIRKMMEECKEQRLLLSSCYDTTADAFKRTKDDLNRIYGNEIQQLKFSLEHYKGRYEVLLAEFKHFTHSFDEWTATEIDGLDDSKSSLKFFLEERGNLTQLEAWHEGYAALNSQIEGLYEDKRQTEQLHFKLKLAEEQLKVFQQEIQLLGDSKEALIGAECNLEKIKNEKESIEKDLFSTKNALLQFNIYLEDVQMESEKNVKHYKEQILTLQTENLQLKKEFQRTEEINSESLVLKEKLEIEEQSLELSRKSQKALEADNAKLCKDIQKLYQQVETLKDEKKNYIDKRALVSMISAYSSQHENSRRREEIFEILCDALELPDEEKSRIGVRTSKDKKKKPLSRLFVEFLDHETN
ncbi:hypothetical protein IE077_001643, partial [Cardiosporidium cionae]